MLRLESTPIHPEKYIVRAVDDVSFNIGQGEIVGYIGPNGAGKSTTIKMMTEILHPTSGSIRIAGKSPQKNRKEVVKNLGVVFGQHTQLYWDIRLGESFELMKRIYQNDNSIYRENIELMSEILKIDELIDVPVRQLSLGQRMRGDLAAAVLHSPPILFLDEPTIGLDIDAKKAIRKFIIDINRVKKTTIILTTHDLEDVQQLCRRLIVINHGEIVEDSALEGIITRLAPHRLLIMDLWTRQEVPNHHAADLVKQEDTRLWYRFDRTRITAAELIADLSQKLPVRDVSVKEPNIEDIISEVYKGKGDGALADKR